MTHVVSEAISHEIKVAHLGLGSSRSRGHKSAVRTGDLDSHDSYRYCTDAFPLAHTYDLMGELPVVR